MVGRVMLHATRAFIPLVSVLALALTGCSSGAATGSGPSASVPSSATRVATSPPSKAGKGPAELPVIQEGAAQAIRPARYITSKPFGFFPGLTLTIPAGWSATEADSGEISLHPTDRPDDAVLLWKDLVAVVTNNRSGRVGEPDKGVGSTAAALVDWLTSTSDFSLVGKPKTVAVAGVEGKQLTLTTSATANFGWNDCPDNPRCAAILTDPKHWGTNFYAIGGSEISQIFVTALHYRGGDHTFFVTLNSPSAAGLKALADRAQPIVDSIRLPAAYVAN